MIGRRQRTGVGALVIGGDYRSLGVVRSLGRHGIRVWVLRDDHHVAQWSRFCERSLPWPEDYDERGKVAYLLDLARRNELDGWTIFPTQDETAALIARNRDALGAHYRLSILAPWETLQCAYDKRLTYRLADRVGVTHPRTWYPRDRNDIVAFDGTFPVIIKPAISGLPNPLSVAKAWPANDRQTLASRYDEACALIDPSLIMVQEVVPGGGENQFSFAALCRDGQPLASLVARRSRQWPIDFGRASTYVETIDGPAVEALAARLLGELRFTGLVEVEFKRDPRDGAQKLLDINPRVWGWHTLGARAGVDFAYLLWRMMAGATISPVRGRAGVRWVRALTDVPTAIGEVAAGRLSLRDYFLSLRRPVEFAVLATDDPLPALVEIPATLLLAWKRRAALPKVHPSEITSLVQSEQPSGRGARR